MESYKKIKPEESLKESCTLQSAHCSISRVPQPWWRALRRALSLQEGLLSPQPGWQDLIAWKAVDSQQKAGTENKPGDSPIVEEGKQPFTFWKPLKEHSLLHNPSKEGIMSNSKREG